MTANNITNIYLQEDEKVVRVLVNVSFNYTIINSAAKSVQEKDVWKNVASVQKIDFSAKWTRGFLNRGGLTRRKITREDKTVPSDEEIDSVLRIGQDIYIANGHSAKTTFNFDETAFTWAIGPTHIFCPSNQQRATNIGISNEKVRITAVIAVSAEGLFTPLMLILKHSVSSEKNPDQTRMTVVRDLHQKDGFTIADGWILKEWRKELEIKGHTDLHKVLYLIHERTGHVITSQVKAWNDTVRMTLWFKVVIKPIKERLGKMLIWCDNCGSHKTTSVMEVIREIGVDVVFLPKNMTGELQVLDLVVNGPLKAHIRTNRANRLYKCFQSYKEATAIDSALPPHLRKKLDFNPPKPTQLEGIKDLILMFEEQFTEEKFKCCINRTFIKTGTLPIDRKNDTEQIKFIKYEKVALCGTMKMTPQGTLDLSGIEESPALPSQIHESEINELERAVLDYYAQTNDVLLDDYDDDESDTDEDDDA